MTDTLEITTKIGCINDCVYCPQDKLIKSYVGNLFMDLKQFRVILKNTPKEIQIDFAGFCEPFLNPFASLMMKHSIKEGYKTVLVTTLTGFSERDADILKGIEFEKIYVHEYQGTPINKFMFDARQELLLSSVKTKSFDRFKLAPEYRWSRAGNLWYRKDKKGKIECGWTGLVFRRNVVLPNGDVYLCCMDYSLKNKLGNLLKTNYNDLNRDLIINLSQCEKSKLICRKCEIAK